ncbi:hypothetical protein RclHR1_04580009 [Rhizophagus clarus]|uniref:Uncharacterized protein n=1 Tax=Rhizophagus clarus TaxID=94130 RepID=A0A2Z6RJP7_9GLOM|nr:hypothetical protein RclHR1_04580009 [Rhizophagus clarus]
MSIIEDNYYELEVKPVFENHIARLQGPCMRWRMNLLAVSDRDKNIMFVAMDDMIFVHQLNINGKPGDPIKKLRVSANLERTNKTINAIKVGKIGNEEVLVSVDEAGDIRIWFTSNLDKIPIQFSINESTWGIALHGPKRLLAVSANSHEITIFNLKESGKFFNEFDDDNDLENSDEEGSQTPRTYASVLTKISENDALGGKTTSVLRGHEHNIPNICFSACGRFLVSCSIDSTCRVWNIKTGELVQTKILTGDWFDLNDNDEWGWTANFVPKSAFKAVSSNCETFQHLTSNPASISSSPRSVETMDSLNLYRQHLRRNLVGQRPNVRAPEDLHRMIISRSLRIRSREYEDGYIENEAHSESGTEEESTDDNSELRSNEDDPELESSDDDTEVGSNSIDRQENNEHFLNRERLTEIEGSATPAYYDRAESATPVVENYTENNPDYRWSVGHELNILNNNHEQSEDNSSSISEREVEKNNDEERSEEIIEERLSQPTQSNSSTHPSYSPRSYTVSEDLTPASSHNTSSSPESSASPSYSPQFSPQYVLATTQFSSFSPHYPYTSSTISPHYSPTSPHYTYSLTSPLCSTTFSTFSPSYNTSPQYATQYSSHNSPNYSPSSPHFSPTSPEHIEHPSWFSTIYSPIVLQNSSSSVSPAYSPVSPEYIPANREPSPYHSYIEESIDDVISGLQQESSLSSPNIRRDSSPERDEIEPISQSTTNIVYNEDAVHDNDTLCSDDSLTIDSSSPSSSREGINSPLRASNNYYVRSHVRIQPLGSSQSDCCPDLGLPDELVLYTTKYDLLLLDPKINLKVLHTEKDLVHKVDTRRYPYQVDFDRLNMVEVIPELSLMIVASQQGKIALTRLIKIVNDNGDENYYLYPEKHLPNTTMNAPLLGMFVAKHNKLQDPALFYYRLYLVYCNGTTFCYEIRRRRETNPLRMDNIFI